MMLTLPETKMAVSRTSHNISLDYLCDWIEASVLFGDYAVSRSDITDILLENEVYEDQDFADEILGAAWGVVRGRYARLGWPLGIQLRATRIQKSGDWREYPAYAFCMMLACTTYLYRSAMASHRDVNAQGNLFERISAEVLAEMLPGWTVDLIGWSASNATKLKENVDGIIRDLCEVAGSEQNNYVSSYSNEIGLDILAYRTFGDSVAAFPVLMVQCASGDNWRNKRHTPDISVWEKIINFVSAPAKGFTMPYAFADRSDLRREATPVQGVFFDRYRLLAPARGCRSALSAGLNADLADYVLDRLPYLPKVATAN